MECTIVKPGHACTFMSKGGCGFGDPSETCLTIADKCEGCDYVQEWPSGRYCGKFASPASKWQFGICNMATHVKVEEKVIEQKVNPLKASKRAMKR